MDAWQELADAMGNPDLEAVAASFVLVACSDGELTASEVDRFVGLIQGTNPPPALDRRQLEARFRALAAAVLGDFDDGRRHAVAAIERARDHEGAADLILGAARIAAVADGKLEDIEETVLREICAALGRDPETA